MNFYSLRRRMRRFRVFRSSSSRRTIRRGARQQALKLGADDYIVKPFIPEIAARRVHNVLEAQQGLASALRKFGRESTKEKTETPSRKKSEWVREGAAACGAEQSCRDLQTPTPTRWRMQIFYVVEGRLKRYFPQGDIIARNGIREFVVSFAGDVQAAELKRMCLAFLEDIREIGADGIALDCSVGAALAGNGQKASLEMLELADKALCTALQEGSRFALEELPQEETQR